MPLTEDAVRRCLSCHVTNPQALLGNSGPEAADHSIGCEKCHGPGGNHLLAIAAKFPDLAIARPNLASGARVVKICAQCHSPRGKTVSPDDPNSVRFQGTTLTWSRCYTESNDALDCVTCHDPHRNAVTSPSHYEARCLSCHGGAARFHQLTRSQETAQRPGRITPPRRVLSRQSENRLYLLPHAHRQGRDSPLPLHRPLHSRPPRAVPGRRRLRRLLKAVRRGRDAPPAPGPRAARRPGQDRVRGAKIHPRERPRCRRLPAALHPRACECRSH